VQDDKHPWHDANRRGTQLQVDEYCLPLEEPASPRLHQGFSSIWHRLLIASAFALFLQWGTVGAAVIVVYFTPTTSKELFHWSSLCTTNFALIINLSELGCRSGAYILYGGIATTIWMMLVLSSFLAHYFKTLPEEKLFTSIVAATSIILRRLGKLLALINSIWIILICALQFANIFDCCYCNSSVLGRGAEFAFNVIEWTHGDYLSVRGVWIGGVVLAAGSSIVYLGFVNLFTNPQLPD
jgi:hypothetical protein